MVQLTGAGMLLSMNGVAAPSKEFKGRHFRWEGHLTQCPLVRAVQFRYRDFIEMMEERGVSLARTTTLRWVQAYILMFGEQWRTVHRSIGSSWRLDKISVQVKGKWTCISIAP